MEGTIALLMLGAASLGMFAGVVMMKNKKEPEMIEVDTDDEIVEVKYVHSTAIDALTEKVNGQIQEGFEPADRVVCYEGEYIQIMVRYD